MRQHMYYDVSNLNAPYDEVVVAAGSLSSVPGLGSLGATSPFQWKEYSEATKQAQQMYNEWAKSAGYCPITVDGVLGPATCGAIREFSKTVGGGAPPACQSFTNPSKQPCGGGYAAPPKPDTEPQEVRTYGGGGGNAWLIGGALIAAGAIGFAVWKRKKRR